MLEQQIIKALLNKEAYKSYRRKITVSDGMKSWFDTLDAWFDSHDSSITPAELHDLHLARHPAITNSAKQLIEQTFKLIDESNTNPEVITTLIETKYNQDKCLTFAEKFLKMGEGSEQVNLAELEKELREFNENKAQEQEFPPVILSADEMLDGATAQSKWKFNLPVWQEKIGGVGPGVFGLFAARPNAGKSLASIYSCFGPQGWAEQGARIFYLGNEEPIRRTMHRAVCCWSGLNYVDSLHTKREEFRRLKQEFDKVFADRVVFHHKTGLDYLKIEDIIREHSPDIILIDQLDKLNVPGDQDGHVRLRKLYTTMREFSTNHGVAIMGVSQASDEASGKKWFGFEALEGSKTGKGAELDLCICIGAENLQQDNGTRHFFVAKNKLTGWEGVGAYMIDKEKSRMIA